MTESWETDEVYQKSIDLALWRSLFAYVLPYRRELLLLCTFAILTAAVDICFPLLTRRVIDDVADPETPFDLRTYIGAYLLLTTLLSLSVLQFIRYGGTIRTHFSHDVRRDGFRNLQRLSFSFYDRRPVGWLMARMTSDCERLSNIFAWGVLDLFWGMTLMLGIAVVLIYLDPWLALGVLTVVPVLVAVSVVFQKRILKSSREVRRTNSQITSAFNESISGVRTTKVFVGEEDNLREFAELSLRMRNASVRNALYSALYLPIVIGLGSTATGVALAAGGIQVSSGSITIGTLVAFMTFTRYFFNPIQELAYWFAEMQMAQASAERILGLIQTIPDIQDSPEIERVVRKNRARGVAPELALDGRPTRISKIEFDDVSFAYEGGPAVLRNFSLEVSAGETIALVGATGSGKTTIVSLLARFYEPTSGEIRVDGTDYRNRQLHWWHSQLGIVLQTPHLFGGSVAENIAYGKPNAAREEIVQAARQVGAHEFIETGEKGYDAEVGEGGSRLSAGERQLVSFARAVLADPQILVLDEATSAVDTETERRIQNGLARVLQGRTSFVIAHRLSTIRSADRILLIGDGQVVEEGTHRELIARRGRYYELSQAHRTIPWEES